MMFTPNLLKFQLQLCSLEDLLNRCVQQSVNIPVFDDVIFSYYSINICPTHNFPPKSISPRLLSLLEVYLPKRDTIFPVCTTPVSPMGIHRGWNIRHSLLLISFVIFINSVNRRCVCGALGDFNKRIFRDFVCFADGGNFD